MNQQSQQNQNRLRNILGPAASGITDTKQIYVNSSTIDDRIDLIFDEIEQGKADPVIRKILGAILQDVPERDYQGELQAIFNWVKKNLRYTHDPHRLELFQKPRRAIELKLVDCDDMAIIIGSMVQSIGYPLRLRVIGVSSNQPEHIYALAGVPPTENNEDIQEWVAMDTTVDQPMGWEYPHNQLKFLEDFEDDL